MTRAQSLCSSVFNLQLRIGRFEAVSQIQCNKKVKNLYCNSTANVSFFMSYRK